jgi:hypothetical protein
MRKAWGEVSVKKARTRMLELAERLDGDHPGAAAALPEGLDGTLTLIALGVVEEWLRKPGHPRSGEIMSQVIGVALPGGSRSEVVGNSREQPCHVRLARQPPPRLADV